MFLSRTIAAVAFFYCCVISFQLHAQETPASGGQTPALPQAQPATALPAAQPEEATEPEETLAPAGATDPVDATAPVEAAEPVEPAEPVAGSSQPDEVIEAELRQTPIAEFDQRKRDQIWLISSRRLPSRNCTLESLEFSRRIDGDQWQPESLESFLQPAPGAADLPVVVYIHGNRNSRSMAVRRGLQTYDQTFLAWKRAPSVRFIIWTWPADRIAGNIRDIRLKAGRAEQHAFHLARLLGKLKQNRKVSVIGYSYGGRLAINALHLAGGGSVGGARLWQHELSAGKVNLTLVAPAIRNDCFCGEKAMSLKQIDKLFLLYNNQDPYLRFFHFTRFDGFNQALGYTGVRSLRRGYLAADSLRQFNAARRVGPEHDYLEYISDRRIEAMVRQNILPVHAATLPTQAAPDSVRLQSPRWVVQPGG